MVINTIVYITLALIIALGFAFYQYLYKKKIKSRKDYIFFALRSLVIFLVLLLLINPKITKTDYEIEKAELVLLLDNSQSISYLKEAGHLKDLVKNFENNSGLTQRFDINRLVFGKEILPQDSLDFSSSNTDIYNALSETKEVFSGREVAVILLSDGNQSVGQDFRYFKTGKNMSVFPLVIGDTATYSDLSIERINSNRYAFLNNRFPVEIFLNYNGNEPLEATFKILSGNQTVYSERLNFSSNKRSNIIQANLPATSLGVKTYTAEIEVLKEEKNTLNNSRNFGVEVIDERTSVLLLTDISHPDLGAIKKAVESNKQRSLYIKNIDDENIQLSNYQLVILYQINQNFKNIFEKLTEENLNYFIITGTQTDWSFLNNLNLGFSRNATNQSQDIFPVYNETFSAFQFEDINFNDFPPLKDKFGPVQVNDNQFNVMLKQEIQGVETGEPLLAITEATPKFGFLLGENIWRWRAKSYLDQKNFEQFDDFFSKIIQNIASSRKKERLTIENKNFYYANQSIIINAQYFDENYQFDAEEDLAITIRNTETKEDLSSAMLLKNNIYEFDGGNLPAGNYEFTVKVRNSNLAHTGSFEVIEYNTEQQFVSANKSSLQTFATNNETKLYYPSQTDSLIKTLLNTNQFKPVQKSHQKTVPLLDWYYLLFILILILAAEWFYRKYLGLI